MKYLKSKLVEFKTLGPNEGAKLITELHALAGRELIEQYQKDDVVAAMAVAVKYGLEEHRNDDLDTILATYNNRQLQEISEAIVDLSDLGEPTEDVAKNFESTPDEGSRSG